MRLEAAVRHAADDAGAVQRLHGGQRIVCNGALVREGRHGLLVERDVIPLCVVIEHDGHVLARDRRVRVEGRGARAADDAVGGRPVDVGRVPGVCGHVAERAVLVSGHVHTGKSGEEGHELRAGHAAGGLEGRGGRAADDAGLIQLLDVRIAPAAGRHIRERERGAGRLSGVGAVDVLHDAAVERVRLDKAAVEHAADKLDVVK